MYLCGGYIYVVLLCSPFAWFLVAFLSLLLGLVLSSLRPVFFCLFFSPFFPISCLFSDNALNSFTRKIILPPLEFPRWASVPQLCVVCAPFSNPDWWITKHGYGSLCWTQGLQYYLVYYLRCFYKDALIVHYMVTVVSRVWRTLCTQQNIIL